METGEANTGGPIVLRSEDGAWYALPPDALERARITDPDHLADVRGHPDADGEAPPAAFLSAEALAPHRLADEQATALAAVAADTAGFGGGDVYGVFRDYNTVYLVHSTRTEGQNTGTLVSIYRVPLDLAAQRALILRLPGYGR